MVAFTPAKTLSAFLWGEWFTDGGKGDPVAARDFWFTKFLALIKPKRAAWGYRPS